jgi:hypothetical protein
MKLQTKMIGVLFLSLALAVRAALVVGVESPLVEDNNPTLTLSQGFAEMQAVQNFAGGKDVGATLIAKATALIAANTTLTLGQKVEIWDYVGAALLSGVGDKTRAATWYGYVLTGTTDISTYYEARRKAKYLQGVATASKGTAAALASAKTLLAAAWAMHKSDETTLTAIDWDIIRWWNYCDTGSWGPSVTAGERIDTELVQNATAVNYAADFSINRAIAAAIEGKFYTAAGGWDLHGDDEDGAVEYLADNPFDPGTLNAESHAIVARLAMANGDITGFKAAAVLCFTQMDLGGDRAVAAALLPLVNTQTIPDSRSRQAFALSLLALLGDNAQNAGLRATLHELAYH